MAIGLQNIEKKNTERNLHEIQEQNVCYGQSIIVFDGGGGGLENFDLNCLQRL